MTVAILDASALLALLYEERGAEVVKSRLTDACVSTVNFSEVVAKLIERGAPADGIIARMRSLEVEVVAFDQAQAEAAGALRATTRHLGLSLGDRACLALAATRGGVAVTADRAWAGLDLGIAVETIR